MTFWGTNISKQLGVFRKKNYSRNWSLDWNHPARIVKGVEVLLEWEFSGWKFSSWEFPWVEILQVGIFLMGIILGGSCLGESFPDGSILVGIIWVRIFCVWTICAKRFQHSPIMRNVGEYTFAGNSHKTYNLLRLHQ